MSWHELGEADHVSARASDLESRRFGLEVSRVSVPARARVGVDDVLGAIRAMPAEVVVLRYPARRQAWFAALAEAGLTLLPADTLVYWSLDVGSGQRPAAAPGLTVERDTTPSSVDDLVAAAFSGYGSHYAANPRFAPGDVLAGYQEWARGTARDGHFLRLDVDGVAAGFATTHPAARVSEVLLAGMIPAFQGRGLYAHLLAAAEDEAAAQGAAQLVISTQGHNTAVQRAWSRYGFVPVECFLTVHVLGARRGR